MMNQHDEGVILLFKEKKYAEVFERLRPLIAAGTDNVQFHAMYAESAYLLKTPEEGKDSFQFVLRTIGTEAPIRFYQQARGYGDSLKNPEERAAFWKACTDADSHIFQNSLSALLRGEIAIARDFFKNGLNSIIQDETEKVIWMKSFDFIAIGDVSEYPESFDAESKRFKKIMVSGKGWSGSGALYAYFSEFDNVSPLDP